MQSKRIIFFTLIVFLMGMLINVSYAVDGDVDHYESIWSDYYDNPSDPNYYYAPSYEGEAVPTNPYYHDPYYIPNNEISCPNCPYYGNRIYPDPTYYGNYSYPYYYNPQPQRSAGDQGNRCGRCHQYNNPCDNCCGYNYVVIFGHFNCYNYAVERLQLVQNLGIRVVMRNANGMYQIGTFYSYTRADAENLRDMATDHNVEAYIEARR